MQTSLQNYLQDYLQRRNQEKLSQIPSPSEYLNRLFEINKSVKMQVMCLLWLILIAFVALGAIEFFYKQISYTYEVEKLRQTALLNAQVIASDIDMENLVNILKDPKKMEKEAKLKYERFNLYNSMLGSEYVYLMLKPDFQVSDYTKISPIATSDVRSSVLKESKYAMRMPFINGYPNAVYDTRFWDDVYDYTKPGPLEALASGEANVSNPIIEHERWGNLISAQAPLFYQGNVIGFLGVDYSLDKVQAIVHKKWGILSSFLIIFATLIITVRTIFTAKMNAKLTADLVKDECDTFIFTMEVGKDD